MKLNNGPIVHMPQGSCNSPVQLMQFFGETDCYNLKNYYVLSKTKSNVSNYYQND